MNKLFQKSSAPEQTEGAELVREAMAQMDNGAAERLYEPKRCVPLTHRLGAKITAFFLVIFLVALTVACVAGAVAMIDLELYITPEQQFRQDIFENLAEDAASRVLSNVINGREQDMPDYCSTKNFARVTIRSEGERALQWDYTVPVSDQRLTEYESRWLWCENDLYYPYEYAPDVEGELVRVSVFIPETLTMEDEFYFVSRVISVVYALRYWIFAIGAAALIGVIVCFVFLLCASGRRKGFSEPQPGWGTWVPLDALTVGAMIAGIALLSICDDAPYFHSALKRVLVYGFCAMALLILCTGWCMSFALRVKLGGWWKNTLIYRVLAFIRWGVGRSIEMVKTLLEGLPLVWKTAAVYLSIAFADALVSVFSWGEYDNLLIWLFFKNVVLFPLILFVALMLRKLQQSARALAEGDLEQGVDTDRLVGEFKRSAEDLGRIGEGMTAAVEQRIRSERMKTELITNVSHDLKTPLTSIINYADLIEKEPMGSEKIPEYAGVLHRQSERLKRLVDDLVEASRASTGDMEMQLAPCELGVLLTQAAGEYEERLKQSRLQLVLRKPEDEVRIMADGRRLWRVFDNLMGNICKYAQPDTRVYLVLEERDGKAEISFKNTSREPLDLGAEELMERFVRGDRSRHSEGNGLGLSIARSLTELQNGTLKLTVDGDLFKVVLGFPVM